MRSGFSEFSYGYTVAEDLLVWRGMRTAMGAKPVFPSLIEEGQPGGGYDLAIEGVGTLPFLLQFKLSDYMVRSSVIEAKQGMFSVSRHRPIYRMHLRATRYSQQHPSLLGLERKGHQVFYIAPAFHLPRQLYGYYHGTLASPAPSPLPISVASAPRVALQSELATPPPPSTPPSSPAANQVVRNSVFITPRGIGALPDDGPHHVAFQHPSLSSPPYYGYLLSEPGRQRVRLLSFDEFADQILRRLHQGQPDVPFSDELGRLYDDMLGITGREDSRQRQDVLQKVHDRSLVQRVAYMAHRFFECQLFIVTA
jgi:hypothetical protein